jgi:hypothetical protein
MSHELVGLTQIELEHNYYSRDPELHGVLNLLEKNN